MGFCTSFGDYLGGCIVTSEAKYLMTIVEKFLDDDATDKTSSSCYEDTHCKR
jgi:hypothetical protein